MTESVSLSNDTSRITKRIIFFHVVEIISVLAFTLLEKFSGLLWIAVLISFLGLGTRLFADNLSTLTVKTITLTALILSSLLWGYIIMYYLSKAPVIYTVLMAARFISTIIGIKEIRDQFIVIIPLLIGFALLQQAGCIPPLDF